MQNIQGSKGIKRKAANPIIDTVSRKNSTWDRPTPVKCRKCLSLKKIHNCTKRNSVQNIVGTLNRKGLADTVVSTIIRNRAVSSMSNVIPLLGYGKMPMKVEILMRNEASENHTVTRNEIIQLQRELNLTNDQLHKLCQFMKRKGLRTPNTRYTQILKKQNVIDLFESVIVNLEDSNGIKSPTEVIYCTNIYELLNQVEDIRGKPSQ